MNLSILVRRTFAGVLVTAALSFPVHAAAAQSDHDMQTLASYRLTESGLRKYYKAMDNLTKAVMKDTLLAEKFESASSDGDDIAAMAAKYDGVPPFKNALNAAGLTSTEFATFALSYMQAAMTYAAMTQGPESLRVKVLPKGTPKANVDFVGAQQALIQQLDKELKALQAPDSGGGDTSE
jgi:hypothetical protein